MIKKLLLLAPLLVINVSALMSCGGTGSCRGIEPSESCATYTGIVIRPIEVSPDRELSEGQAVNYQDLSIELTIRDERHNDCVTLVQGLWGTTANACSFSDVLTITDPVASLEVYSNADYNEQHKAGTNIAEFFSLPSVPELNSPHNRAHYYLDLQHPPAAAGRHTFTVKLNLESGDVLEATTVSVVIDL